MPSHLPPPHFPPSSGPPPDGGQTRTAGVGRGSPDLISTLDHYELSLDGFQLGVSEIEQSPSYLMLKDATLTGDTARRYGEAARQAGDLWPLIQAAEAHLGVIRNHADTKGTTGAAGAELHRLLTDRWFAVTALAGGTPRNYSIGETLDHIRRRYDAIRSAVAEVDQLWVSVLPRVDAARTTIARLEEEARQLGVIEPLIGRAAALADDLADRLMSDPASVKVEDGPNLDAQVAKAASQMAALRTGHDNLDADLNATEELLASLRVLRARAEAAFVESGAKIDNPQGLARVPGPALLDGPDGMAARLDALFENAATKAWTQKRALLDSWLSSARKLENQLTRAEETNRRPLHRRDELRGRLQAYSAKIAASGRAEDMDLAELVDRARSQLYSAPTDLAAAESVITNLAERLRT